MSGIAERMRDIQERIAAAARKVGRDPASVRLMGVTKTVSAEGVREAYDAGLRLFGENYVQEALAKIPQLPPDAEFHMIGHLQSNKAKKVVETFRALEALDRPSLAEAVSRAALALGTRFPVLLEVNLGDEESKAGCSPDEAVELARRAGEWPGIAVRGLMALPPYLADPEEVRPHFRALRELAAKIAALELPGVAMEELSMGMSHDFAAAVEEGSTIVRVGTALFGERKYQ